VDFARRIYTSRDQIQLQNGPQVKTLTALSCQTRRAPLLLFNRTSTRDNYECKILRSERRDFFASFSNSLRRDEHDFVHVVDRKIQSAVPASLSAASDMQPLHITLHAAGRDVPVGRRGRAAPICAVVGWHDSRAGRAGHAVRPVVRPTYRRQPRTVVAADEIDDCAHSVTL